MLRLRFWKPAPGVRSFLIELVIVVLGVLIALGAQQAVDGWNARREVADFEAALKREIAASLAAHQFRVAQGPCLRRRLAQLERWRKDWADGDGVPARGPMGRPMAANPNLAVWRAGAEAVAAMPLDRRLAYAEINDALELLTLLNIREIGHWYELFEYDGAERLSPDEIHRLRGRILAATWTDRSLANNWPLLLERAKALGILPAAIAPGDIERRIATSQLCEPFIEGTPR